MRTLGIGRRNTEDDGIEKQARKGSTKETFSKESARCSVSRMFRTGSRPDRKAREHKHLSSASFNRHEGWWRWYPPNGKNKVGEARAKDAQRRDDELKPKRCYSASRKGSPHFLS